VRAGVVRLPDLIRVDALAGSAEGSLRVETDACYLKDHFPAAPMLPGLLMLEVAVRAAAALWTTLAPELMAGAVLDHLERLQVVRRVTPGETLVVSARAIGGTEEKSEKWFAAVGSVGDETAVRAKFRLRAVQAEELSNGGHQSE
jgi:3-hydroxymyristoyl/3-hydroxydecanoyl-(acyl carrier protein) dehydratase